jgi:hypothetical protein
MSETTTEVAGSNKDNPVWMKFVRDEDDNIQWGRIFLALALTALSGYIASQAQRAGGNIDFVTQARMKIALHQQKLGRSISAFGDTITTEGIAAYEKARPV